jgi:predicted O-linked N-acetylglucosamine transferase (SPINDLY family)
MRLYLSTLLLWSVALLSGLGAVALAQVVTDAIAQGERALSAQELADAQAHRDRLSKYDRAGDYKGMGTYAVTLLESLGDNYRMDGNLPTVHHFLGVAMYNLGFVDEAADAFLAAVRLVDGDLASWKHLTDCLLHRFRVKEACWAAESYTVVRNLTDDVSRLYKARSWIADWTDREVMGAMLNRRVRSELAAGQRPSVGPAEYFDNPPPLLLAMTAQMLQAAPAPAEQQHFSSSIGSSDPRKWPALVQGGGGGGGGGGARRTSLKIGFVSSDWGVHPVSTLMRGAVEGLLALPRAALEVYCFSVMDGPKHDSWWRRNISATVGGANFVSLSGMPARAAAAKVAAMGMHVLVDLNGHTMHTGLPVLAFRPAPLQLSFLGSPLSTGAASIDYYMADAVVVPADAPAGGEDDGVSDLAPGGARRGVGSATRGYSERIVYHPSCYFPTDLAQLHGHALTLPRADRGSTDEPVAQLLRAAAEAADFDVDGRALFANLHAGSAPRTTEERGHAEATKDWRHAPPDMPLHARAVLRGRAFWRRYPVLVAAFTNYQKVTPVVFDSWMHVLQRSPRACLLFLRYGFASHVHAQAHLRASAAERGVDPRRLIFAKQAPWLNHTHVKTAADFVLDATLKNGHTTTADALWAGLPVLTVAGGQFGNRVAKSMQQTLGVARHTEAHSYKDLDDLGATLGAGGAVLRGVRRHLAAQRWTAPLYDTAGWAFSFQARTLAMWEAGRASAALNAVRRNMDELQVLASDFSVFFLLTTNSLFVSLSSLLYLCRACRRAALGAGTTCHPGTCSARATTRSTAGACASGGSAMVVVWWVTAARRHWPRRGSSLRTPRWRSTTPSKRPA